MSKPISPSLLQSLCDAASAREEFEEKSIFLSLYYGVARGNDFKTACFEEYDQLPTGELGEGTAFSNTTSSKTWTSKGVGMLAHYSFPASCWFTGLGDDLATGRYTKLRERDTDTQTFFFFPSHPFVQGGHL